MKIQDLKRYRARRLAQIREFQHYKEDVLDASERPERIFKFIAPVVRSLGSSGKIA